MCPACGERYSHWVAARGASAQVGELSTEVHNLALLCTGDSTRNGAEFTPLTLWQLTGSVREDEDMSHPIDFRRSFSAGARRSGGRPPRQLRRHGSDQPDDRSLLERTGWRTTLDYRENHRRGLDGVLTEVEQRWRGDAERFGPDGDVIVFSAVGPTPTAVWWRLRVEAEAIDAASSSRGADQHVRDTPSDPWRFSRQRLARVE